MAQQPDDSGGKSWERPWSTDEMRQNANNWSLAADAGLLKRLQQFSQDVLSHTHSTEKALDSLLETLNTTNTNITNVTNDFLCLANTQFLESRVYDDDDVDSPQEAPVPDTKQEAAQGESDLLTKVKSALSIGVNLLDTMFEPTDPNSGVENDFVAGVKNRSPKNPYASRPLPHLIGSAAFMADDSVGLASSEKDAEPSVVKAPAMDDLSMYSDESVLTSSVKRNNMDDDSSNTSFCLGDDTPVQTTKPSRDTASITGPENDAVSVHEERSFADELAGKLASMLSPDSRVPPPLPNDQSYEEPVPQKRPSKKKGDMFGLPSSDDEDDALFSGRSGLFSGGRGLFDDMDDADNTKEVFKNKSSTPLPAPVSKQKINSDFFGSNSADKDNDDLFAVPAKKQPAKPAKPADVPPKPLSIGDVISQAAKRNVTAPAPKPVPEKVDRPEKPAEPVPSVPDAMPPPIPTATDKKIPVGGRSMFGAAGLPIPKEALRRRPSSSSSEGSDDGNNSRTQPNSGGSGLFSADEDDLFQPPAPSISQIPKSVSQTPKSVSQNTSAPPPKPVRESTPGSPGEDDLFATPNNSDNSAFRSAGNSNKTAGNSDNSAFKSAGSKSAPKTNNSSRLFDADGSSDEDNLFTPRPPAKQSLFSAVPPPLTRSDDKPKKVSLFDDSDSGDDEFLFSSASSAGSRRSQASADIFNSSSVSLLAEKKPQKKGLFDDDLFSAPVDGPSVPLPTEKKLPKKGLFDDDDNLFSAPVDGSSVPLPKEKKSLKKRLFDDDGLFSAPVDGPGVDIFRGVENESGLSAKDETVSSAITTAKTVVSTSKTSTVPVIGPKPVSTAGSASPAVATSSKPSTSVASSTVNSASPAVATSAKTVSSVSSSSASPAVATSAKPVTSVANSASPAGSTSAKTVSSGSISVTKAAPPSSAASPAVSSSPAVSNSTGGSLFDDDEDLFGVAKPPPLQKPKDSLPPVNKFISAATEDLFSGLDTQTKDVNSKEDDLFGDLPEDDLFASSKTPARGSFLFDNNPKVPVDDLFGTDEGDGDIFVPKKPTLTISDPVVEKVETVKAVPVTADTPKPEPKPDLKPTPPRTLDIRNTTDPYLVSSFDDDEDSEELFKPVPVDGKPKPVVSKPVPVEGKTEPVGSKPVPPEKPPEDKIDKPVVLEQPKSVPLPPKPVPTARKPSVTTPEDEGAKPVKPPVEKVDKPVVSEQPKSVPLPPKPVVTARKPSVTTPEDDGAKPEKPRLPEVLPKPAARASLSKDEDKAPTEKPPVAQPTTEKPPVAQPPTEKPPVTQPPTGMAPVAQLPTEMPPVGQPPTEKPPAAQPPTEKPPVAQPPTEKSPSAQPPPVKARTPLAGLGLNINPLALLPGAQPPNKKTPGEEPVGFDQPIENSTNLHFAQKDRARGSKRRPPSRRARQEAAKVVDHTGVEITSPSSVMSPSTDEDDLFGVPQDLPPDSGPWPFDGAPILSPADPKPLPESASVNPNALDDPLLKARAETSSGTDTDADAADDHSSLFAFVKKKPKEAQPESLFSQAPTLPTKDDVEKVKNSLTDDDVDENDLFKPSAAVKKIADLGSGAKTWKLSDDDDDDLFTTGVSTSKRGIVNSMKELPKEPRIEENKPTSKNEPRAVSKNERSKGLFSQPPKKTERPLFDDDDLDDDDLFSSTSSKPPPLPAPKAPAPVQKKESTATQRKDDLFDDPLSGR